MNRRTELLVYLGATLATIAGLFTLQAWYASYLDVAVVHGDASGVPQDAAVVAVRTAENQKLTSGRMPIEAAKRAIVTRGRVASDRIAPKASDDLSAMSGWVYSPGFKAYQPHLAQAAQATAAADSPTPAAQGSVQ